MNPSAEQLAALEAALFAYGEPMPRATLVELLDIKPEQLDGLVAAYKASLESDTARGLTLLDQGKTVQLVTKPAGSNIVSSLFKAEVAEELTQAALETLALVTYFGPLQRSKLEYIRGVNSAFTLRNLLVRGLIERVPEAGRTGSYQYQASADLLRHVGVRGKEELPDFATLQELLSRTDEQQAAAKEASASAQASTTVPEE